MTGKREKNRRSTAQRILTAARTLILEQNSADFTMPQLAKTAGVALVTPYKHFESKAGVLNALLHEVTSAGEPSEWQRDETINEIDLILKFADDHVSRLVDHERLTQPILSGLTKLDSDTPYMVGEHWAPQWSAVIQPALDAGYLYEFVNPDLVARALHTAMYGAAKKWQIHETNSRQFAADTYYSTTIILLGVASEAGQPLLRHRFADAERSLLTALETKDSDSSRAPQAIIKRA